MAGSINRYPLWKYLLILTVIIIAFVYAIPNLYPKYPAVQVAGANPSIVVDDNTLKSVTPVLQNANIPYISAQLSNQTLLLTFETPDLQLKAKELIQEALGDNYLVALNLASSTPTWLKDIGANPMKLGLDLQGGIHLLLQVDVDSVVQQRVEGDLHNVGQTFRDARIRYTGITRRGDNGIVVQFRDEASLESAYSLASKRYQEFAWTEQHAGNLYTLQGILSPAALYQEKQATMEQGMNTLRNRVNELGISEAIVQQQGESRVSVDLPGVQDSVQAKNILGKTATLEFHMVDNTGHDVQSVVAQGVTPPGVRLYYDNNNRPYLLNNEVILRGSSLVSAVSGFGEDGRPDVQVRLGGMGDSLFTKVTAENVGKPMAVLFIEVKSAPKLVNGKQEIIYTTEKKIISVATIMQALGNSFQITGLTSQNEAQTLALLLRAGALPASVTVIEERQLGPSLGKQNIHMGVLSVEVGMALVVVFMALYYGVMGIIADLALVMNLILIVAVLSLLGATLTLPGIAGMVLTVGMAVDANVLIFERIREELRRGLGIQSSIYAGYERALVTIIDANITTLIVAMVLFSLGSGAVKGFAITLTIGLLTSMFTAIMGVRAVVNLLYGGRTVKHISIGMKA